MSDGAVLACWITARCLTKEEAIVVDKALREGDEATLIGLGMVRTDTADAEYVEAHKRRGPEKIVKMAVRDTGSDGV